MYTKGSHPNIMPRLMSIQREKFMSTCGTKKTKKHKSKQLEKVKSINKRQLFISYEAFNTKVGQWFCTKHH